MPPGHHPRELFLYVPPGGGPQEDQGHTGVTMSLGWSKNALGSSHKCWMKGPEFACSDCCTQY